MKRSTVGASAILLFALNNAAAAQVTPQQVDRVFARWDRKDSPGCALGVVQNGAFVYQRGYGSANLDYGIPNGPDMTYYVGSVSKQFTAAAIALLARDGQINLDDPVSKYIPEVAHLPRMTIRQLVHHTGGVRDIYVLMSLAGIRMEDVLPEADAINLITRQKELNFAPGSEYLYSNSGYLFLAQIVKRVTGKSLRVFADERIFQPLGMTHTHFHDEPYHVLNNRVISYAPAGDGFRISYLLNFDKIGAGGLYTTLGDLLKWDQNFYQNKLGAGFLETIHTRGVLTSGDTLPYAFGLQIGRYRGLPVVRHSGSLMGFKADLVRFPEQRFSVITLCNLDNINPTALNNEVADLYLAKQLAPVAARPNATATNQTAEKAAPVAVSAADYVGSYRSEELDVTYRVEQVNGELRVVGGLPAMRTLAAAERDAFRAGGYTFRFQRQQGRVVSFTIQAGRVQNIVFRKIP
jgi:CubicO group peptidase (beta-lactamase class C family)